MLPPDRTADVAACLARISAAEAERLAALLREAKPADQASIRSVVARQSADALALATRAAR